MSDPKKILIISASGIGCTIMFTPTLKALRKKFPKSRISFLGISQAFVDPIAGSDWIDEELVFDFPKSSLFETNKLFSRLKFLWMLRKRHFDYSLTVFPSNKWFFNLFAWLIGAQTRITHSYETSTWANLSFLQNNKIPADKSLHDVDQNFNLLGSFGNLPTNANKNLFYYLSERDKQDGEQFLERNGSKNRKIIGMHIGSSQDFSFAAKRWPLENFAKLADKIISGNNGQIYLFAGPQETEDIRLFRELTTSTPIVVQQPLKKVAAIIKRCDLFISNDSGLMHIAVAVGTPVVAIFGPTNLTRTTPFTSNCEIVFDKHCHSLLQYPFYSTTAQIDPAEAKKCFQNISVKLVYNAVTKRLRTKKPAVYTFPKV